MKITTVVDTRSVFVYEKEDLKIGGKLNMILSSGKINIEEVELITISEVHKKCFASELEFLSSKDGMSKGHNVDKHMFNSKHVGITKELKFDKNLDDDEVKCLCRGSHRLAPREITFLNL